LQCPADQCQLWPCNATTDRVCGACPNLIRESLTIANLTLQACACSSGALTDSLGALYDTPVLPIACTSGGSTIACENFTCPCTASRRLLAVDIAQLLVVYQAARRDVSIESATKAIRSIIPNALVQEKTVDTLETNALVWTADLANRSGSLVAIVVGVVVFALAVAVSSYYCFKKKRASSKTIDIPITKNRDS
jgi:hypothetical protein